MANYVHLSSMDFTVAEAIAEAEAELAPQAQLGDTVIYTFQSLAGAIGELPAIVHGVQADRTLALTVLGAMSLSGAPVAERRNVRHDPSGEPGTWRHRGGDWQ